MYKLDYNQIGERISQIRRANHYTQENLAEILDVTPKHISHVENASSRFSLKQLVSFCTLFDCSLDYIIFGRTQDPITQKIPDIIVDILEHGSQQERRRLYRYMNMYIELRTGESPKNQSESKLD